MSYQNKSDIQKVICDAANNITNYLLPKLFCFDTEGIFFKKLKKEASWLEKIEDISILKTMPDKEIVILYGSEEEVSSFLVYLDKPGRSIILCINEPSTVQNEQCQNAISIRLITPSVEEVIFHIQAMLIVQQSMLQFNNYFPLFTFNKELKHLIKDIAYHIYNKHPVIVLLNDLSISSSWYQYIFKGLPSRIKPEHITSPDKVINSSNQYCISTDSLDLKNYNFCVCFTQNKKLFSNLSSKIMSIDLTNWNTRPEDLFIKSYLASSRGSFHTLKVLFNTHNLINKSYSLLVNEIIDNENVVFEVPTDFREFIENNNRLSLTSIILEIEYRVLEKLKERTDNVKGVSLAAGMNLNTWQKKIQRFKNTR